MYELALFAGAGGGILGGILDGRTCVGAVEIERYPRRVLMARQRDGMLPWFPIWDDICTLRSDNPACGEYFDFLRSVSGALCVSGGFPCQDISAARTNNHVSGKQLGLDGAKSGLWREMRRVIGEVQPASIEIENSPLLRTRGLVVVLRDLAEMGYDAKWGVLGCRGFGADHIRERFLIVASHANSSQCEGGGLPCRVHQEHANAGGSDWWKDQPGMERVADGMANRLDRLRAIGNGQVPAVASLAWRLLR